MKSAQATAQKQLQSGLTRALTVYASKCFYTSTSSLTTLCGNKDY